jgi:hypothetical protein
VIAALTTRQSFLGLFKQHHVQALHAQRFAQRIRRTLLHYVAECLGIRRAKYDFRPVLRLYAPRARAGEANHHAG